MRLSFDYLIERKRNKKQLTIWKIITLILLILLAVVIGRKYYFESDKPSIRQDYIARILINDVINDDLEKIKNLDKIRNNPRIKALIVHLNSPGGSIVGSEMLYNSINKISNRIPVVAVMGSYAASGAYLVSLASDYSIAHNGTITGSIGVIMQSTEITELAKKIGIKFNNLKSGPLKADPNLTEKLTPEAYNATMESIYMIYTYFIELVASKRKLDLGYVKKLSDGRIYSGRQALDLKLIDAIGDEDTARDWLEKEKNLAKNLKIMDIKLKSHENYVDIFFSDFNSKMFNFLGSSIKKLQSII